MLMRKAHLFYMYMFHQIWNFESIDNADATEDNTPCEIEPLTEIKVSTTTDPLLLIKGTTTNPLLLASI